MGTKINHFYEFGHFRVDPSLRLLLRDGQPVPLQPKAFETLLVLIENNEKTVLKNDLMKALWPDSFVEESNLSQNVFVLRKALGDNGNESRYIVTLPGKGYRFAAKVIEVSEKGADGVTVPALPPLLSEPAQPQHPLFRYRSVLPVVTGLLTLILLVAFSYRMWVRPEGLDSIAVLPFLNLSPDPAKQYVSDGVTEELTTELAQLPRLRVAARTSAFQFRGQAEDVRAIGRKLDVTTVLEGSVNENDDQVRITAQLVSTRDGYHIWSQAYDGTKNDMQALERRAFRDVSAALLLPVPEDVQRRLSARDTQNAQAHDLYLRARFLWNQRQYRDNLEQSIALLHRAIATDPNYALAYAALADAYAVKAVNDGIAEPAALARTAANRALELDPTLAEPHAALGLVESQADWNFAQAEQEFQKAIALVPDYAPAHHWRGQNLTILERFPEAEQELRRAQILDPTSLMITDGLAENYFYWRRYDEAAEQARAMLALEPRHTSAIFIMGWVETQKGMYKQALAGYQQLDPSLIVWQEKGIGATYAAAGDKEKALKIEANLEARSAPATYIAPIYAALGDKEKALSWLEEGYRMRDPGMVYLRLDPRYDNLRSDPRYRVLVDKIWRGI